MLKRKRVRVVLALVWAVFLAPECWAQAEVSAPSALDRPSRLSAKAESATLLSVTRAGKRLVAAGERGIILTSEDEGASWKQSRVPTSVNLTALRFVDARRGWAVGHMGMVLHSEDGGLSWVKQLDGIEVGRLALEAARGSGDERALKQANYLVSDGPDKPFFDLWMDGEGRGYVVGAFNLMLRTQDGGAHWSYWSRHVENPYGLHLYGITRVGEVYYVAGEQGLLLRSRDGGEHFESLESPYEGSWFGILGSREGDLLAYGLRGNAYVSSDGGESWRACETGSQASFSAAKELEDGRWVLVNQAGQLFASRDRGRSFQGLKGLPGQPFASLTEAACGDLILSGLRGLRRLEAIPLSRPN
jgi:photosystem II stability/assembly factor-like uncharacterized protein